MARSTRSYVMVSCALFPALVACGGDDPQTPVDSGSGADSASDASNDAIPDADAATLDADAAGPTFALGGTVHFLESGTKLRIKNGAQTVDVTQNGAFALPAVPAGSSYDVSVEVVGGNQLCSVRGGGKGTANANVSDVAIACVVAKEALSPTTLGQTWTTLSPTYVDFDPNAPFALTLENDVATKALVSLTFPQLAPPLNGGGMYAIFVDGAAVSEGFTEDDGSAFGVPAATYAVVDLPAGTHAVAAKWRTAYLPANPTKGITYDRTVPIRLSAIALGSLATFGETAGSKANQGSAVNQTALLATEAAPVSVTLPAAAPLLELGFVPFLGCQAGAGVQIALDDEGTKTSTQHLSSWGERNSLLVPVVVPAATAGKHTIGSYVGPATTGTYAKGDSSGKNTAVVRHDVIAFTPSATVLRGAAPGDKTTSSSTFADLDAAAKVTLPLSSEHLVLVVLHEAAAWSTGNNPTGDVALDVDGLVTGLSTVRTTDPARRGSAAPAFYLLRMTAGSHVIKGTFRARGDGVQGSSNVFHVVDPSVSAIVLE